MTKKAHLSRTELFGRMEDADGTGPTASDFPIDVEDTDDRLRLADQLLAPVLDQFVLGAGGRIFL